MAPLTSKKTYSYIHLKSTSFDKFKQNCNYSIQKPQIISIKKLVALNIPWIQNPNFLKILFLQSKTIIHPKTRSHIQQTNKYKIRKKKIRIKWKKTLKIVLLSSHGLKAQPFLAELFSNDDNPHNIYHSQECTFTTVFPIQFSLCLANTYYSRFRNWWFKKEREKKKMSQKGRLSYNFVYNPEIILFCVQ